ncbi:pentapeptide repeat-containing protein [Campylobacter concisus]|uniref:pentapeptide repeat-containing protein n=1 Tax=Campylobacter concisus TaxID=199 RepID=UPI000CD970D1|nr:pentapeptide repeat-containing protein [Campylobacter concisus]MBE9818005.1 pentapeptide repeat-containing protein [Campylobacter concisus]
MGLDIDKILQEPREEIEQKELERFQEIGILNGNIDALHASGQNSEDCLIEKCTQYGQVFFFFKGFYLDQNSDSINHVNLEKYLQSDEFNIVLLLCDIVNNPKPIEDLNRIKRKVIIVNSRLPNISSCKFENEVFLHNITKGNTFSGCEFAKEVYVEGRAHFHSCTFNGDFISQNSGQDISFASSVFNKSFKLDTKNELGEVKFEDAHFKQKFAMDIGKFSVLDFSSAKFYCELNLHARQFDGININFTNATFNQKLSFHRSIINCGVLFKDACFESDLIFTETKFNDVVNLDKAKFKGKAQFRGTKFNRAILTETTFENKADFSNAVVNEKAYFTNAVFKADADFRSATFANEARFFNTDFKDVATFENTEIKGKTDFKTDKNLTFRKDVDFNNATFHDNAYFNNRVFENFVDFHETDFKKIACFYGVAFKKPVNFSSSIFNGASNFINAKIDFTYEELKKHIKNRSKNIDECISTANDFRDSFRLIKHAFNEKGNALDASLFHCIELCCKELELEFALKSTDAENSKNDKEVKSADNVEAKSKSKNRIEILLDLITLKLYRNISDHHTNLLRIINFMVLTIAAYGLCFYIFDIFLLETIVANPKALVFSIILCYIAGLIVYMNLDIKQSAVAVIATLICVFYGISKYYPIFTIDFILLYLVLYYIFFYLHKFRLAKILTYLICIVIFLSKPFLIAPFIGVFTSEQAAQSKFKEYAARYNENGLDDMLLDANLTNTKKDDKLDFIVKNRKMILEELECEKTLLINSKNKCAQNTDETAYSNSNSKKQEITKKPYAKALNALKYDEIMQSTQKSANLLYSFIMLLVVYSLTKTARRNSLVPS